MKPKIRLVREDWYAGAKLMIQEGDSIATSITMETRVPGNFYEPILRIEDTEAQVLMNDLWQAGYRPTEGTGSAGSLAATEKHLNDMRAIVSKQLEIKL